MSKKKTGSIPVNPPKEEDNTVYHIDSVTATRLGKPYQVAGFRTGAHEDKRFKRKGKGGSRTKINPKDI